MFKNEKLLLQFAEGIQEFYIKIIVPYYESKSRSLKISKEIALKFAPSLLSAKEVDIAQGQLTEMERKAELDVNGKKI